ncbi:MAG: hypothetical protein QNL62_17050 [Gammaproteobacteria bacterium]|nr:hypothetical protein [Gammaproteobacteria bacterium]
MRNLILFIACIAMAGASLAKQELPSDDELIVAYYGRPGTASLGVLGQYSIEELMAQVKAKADEYAKVTGNNNVVPAFDLIYGLASSEPGRKKDYILPLSDKKLMPYINAAKSNGFAVFIDLQLGKMTPVEAVKPVLHYLKYDNVHLAIDPEFEVKNLDVRPGKVIGHISGEQVNEVQSAMADYMKDNGITENKILVVHMFTHKMVRDKKLVKNYDKINLIMNLDGHGSPNLKTNTYNGLYTADVSAKVAGGFKLFFSEDKPSMMTPRQVMGMDPVGKIKINEPPQFINYQ